MRSTHSAKLSVGFPSGDLEHRQPLRPIGSQARSLVLQSLVGQQSGERTKRLGDRGDCPGLQLVLQREGVLAAQPGSDLGRGQQPGGHLNIMTRLGRTNTLLTPMLESRSTLGRGGVQRDSHHGGNASEVTILGQQGGPISQSDGGNHAVDHPSWSNSGSSTRPVDPGSCIEVDNGIEVEQIEAPQEASDVLLAFVISRAGSQLHDHRLSNAEGLAGGDDLGQSAVDVTTRGSIELDPRRRVSEDHAASAGPLSAGSASRAWAPLIASASSRDIG
jgi:hypothetical protein